MNPSPLKQKPALPIHIPGMKITCPIPASSNIRVPSNYYFQKRLMKYLRPFVLPNPSTSQDTRLRIVHRTMSRIHTCVNALKFPNQSRENTLQFSTSHVMSQDVSTADGTYSALTNFWLSYLVSLGTLSHRGKQILRKTSNHLNVLCAIRVASSKFHTQDPQILGATEHNLLARVTWGSDIFHSCLYMV
jgi:hypothetical protein